MATESFLSNISLVRIKFNRELRKCQVAGGITIDASDVIL